MTHTGPIYFFTGIPDSKVATLPSCPRKGKASKGDIQKPATAIKQFLWGGFTVEINNTKKENDE